MPKSSDAKGQLERLYPDLTDDERVEIDETLGRYLAVVRTLYERVSIHNPKILTELRSRARLRKGRKALK